jgi:hypothetical protein
MSAIDAQLELDGFAPRDTRSGDKERSLFSAVRRAHEMAADDADVLYWNWREMRAHLLTVWRALDEEASARNGRSVQAHVWTFSRSTTLRDVRALVAAADRRYTGGPLILGRRRRGIDSAYKAAGAICSTLGVLRTAHGISTREILDLSLQQISEATSDEMALCMLDDYAFQLGAEGRVPRPREMVKVLNRYYTELSSKVAADSDGVTPQWGFVPFVRDIVKHTREDIDDEALLAWLKERSPDHPRAAEKLE